MTSASTLVRQAKKAKTKAEAKALRAKAALMRRTARKAKEARKADGMKVATQALLNAVQSSQINASRSNQDNADDGRNMDKGTFNLVPIGYRTASEAMEARLEEDAAHPFVSMGRAEVLMKLARKKSINPETFHNELVRLAALHRLEAKQEASTLYMEHLKRARETNDINVVCAFIASVEGVMRANGGSLSPSIVVAGYTVARVLEALKAAGYSESGLKSMSRQALEARTTR